jgi:iron complex outermembrane recepter protein
MHKGRYFCGGSALAVAASLFMGGSAWAQDEPQEVEEVVVTGSFIAGTPEDAALPVDVINAAELERQGSPTVVQMVRTITASGSTIGESNRYTGGAGTAAVNLRGFGSGRTLALMNGRRMADNPIAPGVGGGGANLNFVPTAAIGRVEVLKEGAAALYGSEAIGGVVNFITRRDLDGLELEGEYAFIDGSDGDYNVNAAWGWVADNGNVLVTAGYRHRSRLDIHERDWAIQPFEDAGYGGWTGAGNPGFYVANNAAGTFLFRDNGCSELGGFLDGTTASSVCRFQFSNFNDLVNEEDHYQFHAEFNLDLGENHTVHAEATWANDEVPMQRLSPANLSTQFPTPIELQGTSRSNAPPGALNFFVRQNVPWYHPGLVDLYTTCAAPLTPAQCLAISNAANAPDVPGLPGERAGVDISQTVWRAIAHAGHPTNPDKADHQTVESTAFRFSGGIKGDLTESVSYDVALTYMEAEASFNTNDLLVTHIQLALNGWGSLANPANENEICRPAERTVANAGNTAIGCHFFNPFTNSIAVSAVNNQPNPYYRGNVNPAVINNPRAVEWLYGNYTNELTNRILVADAVFSGQTGIELGGGPLAWAAGAQFRYNREINIYGDLFDVETNPCVDSVDDDTPVCGAPAGPLIFFGSNTDSDFDRNVWAVFGELAIPLFENLEISTAIRYEEYRGGIGSTTNPKIAARWQALDWLAFRASAGTTFRAPTAANASGSCTTGVANINGQYRAIETCGNPEIQPETADAYNVGLIVEAGNFNATLDYFLFEFEGELTVESPSRLFSSMFPGNSSVNCGNPALAPLQARFAFAGGVCSPANVLRIQSFVVNGPATETSGVDFRASYDIDELMGGQLQVGVEATYLIEYKRGAFTLTDTDIEFAPPEDRAGLHDLVSQFFSYPQLRANGWVTWSNGPFTGRWQVRYIEGTEGAFGTPLNERVPAPNGPPTPIGKTDDFWQHDLIFRYEAPWDTTVTFSIQNVLDEDPSDAPSQYNYDYTTGNPLGRVFEVGLKKRF